MADRLLRQAGHDALAEPPLTGCGDRDHPVRVREVDVIGVRPRPGTSRCASRGPPIVGLGTPGLDAAGDARTRPRRTCSRHDRNHASPKTPGLSRTTLTIARSSPVDDDPGATYEAPRAMASTSSVEVLARRHLRGGLEVRADELRPRPPRGGRPAASRRRRRPLAADGDDADRTRRAPTRRVPRTAMAKLRSERAWPSSARRPRSRPRRPDRAGDHGGAPGSRLTRARGA